MNRLSALLSFSHTNQSYPKRSLRKFLIYPTIQLKIISLSAATCLVFATVLLWLQHQALNEAAAHFQSLARGEGSPWFEAGILLRAILCCGAFTGVLFLLLTVYTHRIVGPMYAILRHLKSLNNGDDTAPLNLRQSDFFHDIAEELNKLAARIKK